MSILLEKPVLVLNRLWQPVHTTSARRALKLLFLGHAQVVQEEGEAQFQTHDLSSWIAHSAENLADEVVRTVRLALRVPKVIVLGLYDKLPRTEVKFCRANVYLRDGHECQYCGKRLPERLLNLDHVIPRDKGGVTSWDNIVTSCIKCNTKKANKLPAHAGMYPKNPPKAPKWRPMYGMKRELMDRAWHRFVPFA